MKIIVFSGNANTGKTTALEVCKQQLLKNNAKANIKIFEETARIYLNTHTAPIDIYEFQKYIRTQEQLRLQELEHLKKTDTYDYVIIDRTILDGIIYSYRNMLQGKLTSIDFLNNQHHIIEKSRELYDHIIFFQKPFKTNIRFDSYNNPELNGIFEHSLLSFYGEKIMIYENNIYFQDNISQLLTPPLFF